MLLKRFYAHKRRYKAICGHKSCKKQDSQFTDIFDTKMDLNPFMNKILDVEFGQNDQKQQRAPVNRFPIYGR